MNAMSAALGKIMSECNENAEAAKKKRKSALATDDKDAATRHGAESDVWNSCAEFLENEFRKTDL